MLIFLLFILITSKIVKNNEEYLSIKYTNVIKGIFLFLVFFRHLVQYNLSFSNKWIDNIGLKIDSNLGQLIVTLFLFYSGYGIMESVKRKGKEYINNLPRKRILPTLIHFDVAVIVFIIVTVYMGLEKLSVKQIILSLLGWKTYGNSNWYIFCIIILYSIAFLSLKAFKDNKSRIISILIGTILYTMVCKWYRPDYVYNTAFCFVLGIIYSMYKTKIESWVKNREILSFIYLLALFIVAYNLKRNIIWYYIHTLVFTLIVIIITRKIKIKNFILEWMGKNLFPLYIFQRLPMIVLNEIKYMKENPYIFFIVAFISTIIITIIYNLIIFLWEKEKKKVLKNRKEKRQKDSYQTA